MNKMFLTCGMLFALAPIVSLAATESNNLASWDWTTTQGTVSYSGSQTPNDPQALYITPVAKFNSSIANTALGTSGQTYTLSSVTITLGGEVDNLKYNISVTAGASGIVESIKINSLLWTASIGGTIQVNHETLGIAGSTQWTGSETLGTVGGVSHPESAQLTPDAGGTYTFTPSTVSLDTNLDPYIGKTANDETYELNIAILENRSAIVSAGAVTTKTSGNFVYDYTIAYTYTSVPEPTTAMLLGFGFAALLIRRKRTA